MATLLPVEMTMAEVPRLRGTYGHKAAHKVLHELRAEMGGGRGSQVTTWWVDLTDQLRMPWQAYLAGLPEVEEILGVGAAKFLGVFLKAQDANMQQPRFDFLLLRADLTGVRLHPAAKGPGKVVICNPALELPEMTVAEMPWMARAAPPSLPTLRRADVGFEQMHQQDVLGKKQVAKWLQEYTQRWYERDHPRGEFFKDITDLWPEEGEDILRWPHYVNSSSKLRWAMPEIQGVAVCWLTDGGRAGLMLQLHSGLFFVDPIGGSNTLKPASNICWQ